MSIQGKVRENQGDFGKKVGLFEAKVIAINPTEEQYKELLDMELKEGSKAADYLSERDGNTILRVDVWLEDVKKPEEGQKPYRGKVSFFLEDKERENKDKTKRQYINNVGSCSWASDAKDLPKWFSARDYRVAYAGEEDLYNFLRMWLSKLDYRDVDTVLQAEWKKLMKGDVKMFKEQINGEFCSTIGAMSIVITKEKENEGGIMEVVEFPGIYNKAFLYPSTMKNFKSIDYSNPDIQAKLEIKTDLKPHERFVLNVIGEYGCKDFYSFEFLKDYEPSENPVATSEPKPTAAAGSEY